MTDEKTLKNHYEYNQRMKILEKHLGEAYYKTGELHNRIDDAILEILASNRLEKLVIPKIAEEHIKCALKNLGNIANRKAERWSIVGALFGLGSGSSTKICQEYGIDPFEIIGEDKCNNCELVEE